MKLNTFSGTLVVSQNKQLSSTSNAGSFGEIRPHQLGRGEETTQQHNHNMRERERESVIVVAGSFHTGWMQRAGRKRGLKGVLE